MSEKVVAQVRFEIEQIDRLLDSYADLLERALRTPPNLIELTAIASVLHSFYNGLENIFLSIAKGINDQVPAGTQWHRDLLAQMAQATPNRVAVLPAELSLRLAGYLGFRHFYRHSYTFYLEWDEVEDLVKGLHGTWSDTKRQLERFLAELTLKKDIEEE